MADEYGAATTSAGEEIATDQTTVACDGGGALGHPRVFLHMEDGRVECPYCGRQYVLTGGAGSAQEPAH